MTQLPDNISRPYSEQGRDNWDRIFAKKHSMDEIATMEFPADEQCDDKWTRGIINSLRAERDRLERESERA